ncbi:MAG: hypothetical protein KAJ64_06895, partial [Thermoplasmata archaeon]|nr:hypothetical protein [Thermoplasmata archaeon]
ITLIVLVLLPLVLEYTVPIVKKFLKKDEETDKDTETKSGPDEITPEELDPGDGGAPDIGNDDSVIDKELPETPASDTGNNELDKSPEP